MFDCDMDSVEMFGGDTNVVDVATNLFDPAFGPSATPSELVELTDSVMNVAHDMHMPMPEIYNSPGSYGEHLTNDPDTLYDDKIGADPNVVHALNEAAGDPRAYEVVAAHEMMHAKVGASGLRDSLDPHSEELLCDINAGLHAGRHGISGAIYDDVLVDSLADSEHPCGTERVDVFNRAREIEEKYPEADAHNLVIGTLRKIELGKLTKEVIDRYPV